MRCVLVFETVDLCDAMSVCGEYHAHSQRYLWPPHGRWFTLYWFLVNGDLQEQTAHDNGPYSE